VTPQGASCNRTSDCPRSHPFRQQHRYGFVECSARIASPICRPSPITPAAISAPSGRRRARAAPACLGHVVHTHDLGAGEHRGTCRIEPPMPLVGFRGEIKSMNVSATAPSAAAGGMSRSSSSAQSREALFLSAGRSGDRSRCVRAECGACRMSCDARRTPDSALMSASHGCPSDLWHHDHRTPRAATTHATSGSRCSTQYVVDDRGALCPMPMPHLRL